VKQGREDVEDRLVFGGRGGGREGGREGGLIEAEEGFEGDEEGGEGSLLEDGEREHVADLFHVV